MMFESNCPIREQTADGICVGRCWYFMSDGHTCPLHGDVQPEIDAYRETGVTTLENNYRKRKGMKLLVTDG